MVVTARSIRTSRSRRNDFEVVMRISSAASKTLNF